MVVEGTITKIKRTHLQGEWLGSGMVNVMCCRSGTLTGMESGNERSGWGQVERGRVGRIMLRFEQRSER